MTSRPPSQRVESTFHEMIDGVIREPIACEQMFRAIYEQHKLPYVGLRYMNVYGPRMDYQVLTSA